MKKYTFFFLILVLILIRKTISSRGINEQEEAIRETWVAPCQPERREKRSEIFSIQTRGKSLNMLQQETQMRHWSEYQFTFFSSNLH